MRVLSLPLPISAWANTGNPFVQIGIRAYVASGRPGPTESPQILRNEDKKFKFVPLIDRFVQVNMMDSSEVRKRKGSPKSKKTGKIKDVVNDYHKSSEEDLKEIGRDSGDGDSAPGTPPPELRNEEVVLEKKNSKKIVVNAKQSDFGSLSFQVDGISVMLFIISFITRIWKIETPRAVVFDELHYGKYAGLYMQNTFFFDSQPPLGKQLVSLAAYLGGFNGDFKFERIGQNYDASVPVVAMRLIPAFFGSLLMPVVYNLFTEMGLSRYAGILAAFLMICDNALLAQSRFILMESMILFFGIFGVLCILKLRRFYDRAYTFPWFLYLLLGASSLSAAFCVKYFGMFTFILGVGILTKDFWTMVGDRRVSDLQLFMHSVVRTCTFVAVPLVLYLGVFSLHLTLLYKAGPNDNVMTSAFQASLEGGLAAIIANQPVKVLHGSQITLRHTHGRTCWLHSHDEVYPVKYADDRGSSHQQQVTCYSYKDVNNWWIVKKPEREELVVTEPHLPIKHGDVVQLVHGLTSRALNSHDVAAPMSPHSQEVSCYVDYNVSMPAQNLWRVDLLNKESTDGFWHAVESQVRLIHVNTSSALRFSGRQLPDWGFRQHEIVADKALDHEDVVWNVEEHRYSRVEDQKEREKELIQQEMIPTERRNLTFFEKLLELQYKMLFNNQENVAGHMYASEPLDWLTLKRGVAYWISSSSNAQVHFLGNVVVWISGTLGLVCYVALFTLYLLRRQRSCFDLPDHQWDRFCSVGEVFMCGYLVHYLPYFLVDRTLFLHHYMPAYVFKICLLAALVDHGHYLVSKWLRSRVLTLLYALALGLWLAAVVYVFVRFLPVTYADVDLTSDQIADLSWRPTWDLIVHK